MKRKIIPYNPKLKEIARTLRNNSTLGEVILWKKLRNKQMLGYDFHRQKPIDQFIVDFYSPKLKLAIEIDGGSHETEDAFEKDRGRQARLESLGIKFLRFKESEVRKNIRRVLDAIEHWIITNSTHTHPLSPSRKTSNAAEGI
jgi:very-short-patch-repair endonuclease